VSGRFFVSIEGWKIPSLRERTFHLAVAGHVEAQRGHAGRGIEYGNFPVTVVNQHGLAEAL